MKKKCHAKICMLLDNPVTNDPRVRREAASLVSAGYDVTVLGMRAEGYVSEEKLDGYRIIRIQTPGHFYRRLIRTHRFQSRPHTEGATIGFRDKLRADVRNIVSVVWFNLLLVREALKQRADVYHAHDLDTLLAGCLAKLWVGKRLVYDFHELYTEQFKKGVKTKLWCLFYFLLERFLIKQADQIMTVCDSLASWVSHRYNIKGVITLKNVPAYQSVAWKQGEKSQDKVILYHGAYFQNRGLEQLIESAQYLERGRIVLRGYGECEHLLRALTKSKGLEDKVFFAPPVPMVELVRMASEADIGVAPFLPICLNTEFCLPNKLFEYMMAGLAIAGTNLPEMRKVILGHKVGVVFDNPEDPRSIAQAINDLLKEDAKLAEMKQNALRASKDLYNWESESKVLLKFYDDLVSGGKSV